MFDKTYFSYHYSQPLCDVLQKEFENLEFVQGVNFEFIDSLKNNDTKYLLIINDSCEEICYSKAFVDMLTLLPLGDNRLWSQSTLNITVFTWANYEGKLSYKTLRMFPSSLPVM